VVGERRPGRRPSGLGPLGGVGGAGPCLSLGAVGVYARPREAGTVAVHWP
jgi:hypothetical protein